MSEYLLVGIGAAGGGMMRYWLAGVVQRLFSLSFPYGTLSVNMVGGFLIGIIMYFFDYNNLLSPEVRILLTIGFCGGLTTFSSFSLETMNMILESEYFYATINILLNVVFSLGATLAGLYVSKLIGGLYGN